MTQVTKLPPPPSLYRTPRTLEDAIAQTHQVERWYAEQGRDIKTPLSAEDLARANTARECAAWRRRKRKP